MNKSLKIVSGMLVVLAASAGITYAVASKDISAAHGRTRGAQVLQTAKGQIEYIVVGQGAPVLIIHGTSGGFVQGQLLAEMLSGPYQYIIPSRFGYLGTAMRADASPVAQAEAHVELLNALGVKKVAVVAASAGALSAVELAARYPDRVSGLLLISPAAWSPDMEVNTPPISPVVTNFVTNVVLKSDFAFWLMSKLAHSTMMGFLATPPALEQAATPEELRYLNGIVDTLLTVSRQGAGLALDASNHVGRQRAPLEKIVGPMLVVSSQDDLYKTMPGARYIASQTRSARLLPVEHGGHLLIGGLTTEWDEARRALASFVPQG